MFVFNLKEKKNKKQLKRNVDSTKRLDFVVFIGHEVSSPHRNGVLASWKRKEKLFPTRKFNEVRTDFRSLPVHEKHGSVGLLTDQIEYIECFKNKRDD